MSKRKFGHTPGDGDLDTWTLRWDLDTGHLRCRSCGWAQWPHQARVPFTHAPDCSTAGKHDDFPWRDLMWIIELAESNAQQEFPPSQH